MKRKTIIHASIAGTAMAFMVAGTIAGISLFKKKVEKTDAYTASSITDVTTINLNDTSEANIRNYYSSLNDLSTNERQGTNLLKNLKPILKNGQKYYRYDSGNLWAMYEISDRDWEKSPASAISGYNATTNTITGYSYGSSATNPGSNPYIHALYVNREDDNLMRAWARESDGAVSHGDNKEWGFDQEHIWAKSQGFEAKGKGGARGDPMHLWPGDSDVNSSLHSNNHYGYVNITSSTKKGKWSYGRDNYIGTSLTLGTTIASNNVFEPQDCDKGDIARAIFYLVARYNFLSGSDSDGIDSNNPNLELVQSNESLSSYTSSTTLTGKMGILTDLLVWNRLDPPDEWEIHRNNLLYNNYTNNRNPFIDFPEWAEYIWGKPTYNGRNFVSYDGLSTGYADVANDTVNGYNDSARQLESITITTSPTRTSYYVGEQFDKTGMVVTATYDDGSSQVVTEQCTFLLDTSSAGTKTLTVTYKSKTTSMSITVLPNTANVSGVSLNKTSATIVVGGSISLTATVSPINAANKSVNWTSSNTNAATVNSSGIVTGVGEGNTTITATTVDGGYTASCAVQVNAQMIKVKITDPLTRADTGVTSGTYTSWSNKVKESGAIYAGQSAGGNSSIQLRSSNSNSGVISTGSGGLLKKVTITWNANTTEGRVLNIYGSNTAYSNPTELYSDSTQGTLLGTITKGTSTELDIEGDYAYVGIRANDGALYCTQIDIQWEKEVVSADIPVSGISMPSTYSMQKGTTATLTATITPAEATNKNTAWESSCEDVATVTDEGVVTAISVGTTIISVTTEDGYFTAECTLTVTPASVGTTYYEKQTSLSSISNGDYVICAKVENDYYPMPLTTASTNNLASDTPITVTDGKISIANAANYVVSLNVSDSSVAIKNSSSTWIGGSANNVVSNATSAFSWALETGENGTFRLSYVNSSNATRVLAYRLSGVRFASYAVTNVTSGSADYFDLELFKYTQGSGSYTVDNFVEDFLKSFTCDATGTTAPTFATGASWATLKAKFQSLTTTEQNELKNYIANQNGNDEAKCVARYDYIVGKYGINTYENFMNRNIVSHSNRLGNAVISNNAMLLLVVMATLGTFTFAAWFIHKKKQYDL